MAKNANDFIKMTIAVGFEFHNNGKVEISYEVNAPDPIPKDLFGEAMDQIKNDLLDDNDDGINMPPAEA